MAQDLSKEHLASLRFIGEAGGGLVKVTVDGLGLPVEVEIDKSLFNNPDLSFISDLFVAATRAGVKKSDEKVQEMMVKELTDRIEQYANSLGQYDVGLDGLGGGNGKLN